MSLPEDLLPGSFRGVPFLMSGATTSGVKKIVKKTFPNSTRQSIENLGRVPNTFGVTAILTGDDYIQRRNSLKIALDNDDFGTLIHPFYGTIENVIAANYTIEERMTSLADSVITITFEVKDDTGIPLESGTTLSVVGTQNDNVIGSITDSYNETFNVSGNYPNNFARAVGKMNDLVEEFGDNASFLSAAADEIDSFTYQLNELAENITNLVTDPVAFSTSVNNLFETLNGLYTTPGATLAVLEQFFDFGDDDNFIPDNTAGRLEAINNNAVFNQYIQAEALSYSYFNATEVTFDNVEQVEEVAQILEDQYQKIFNNRTVNDQNPNIGISPESKSQLTDMRVIIQEYFNEQRLTTQQIIEVFTQELPGRVIAYQYYGSSELGEEILDLNQGLSNPSFLKGDIRILSA